jgi:hypothetical protein
LVDKHCHNDIFAITVPFPIPNSRGGVMRLGRLSDRERLRAELQQAMEGVGRLDAGSRQQGIDARDLEAIGSHVFAALQALDRSGPAENAAMPDDPRARAAQLITAALMATQLVEEMVDALAVTSMRIEAVPVKVDLLELTARMDALNEAFHLVASGIVRTNAVLKRAP